MSFEEALAACAGEIDALLDELLPGGPLGEAMRYAALGKGKRLRPFLVVESARLFEVQRSRALRVGAALECVHCYSLAHDDLPAMDDDDLRRGKPSLHRAFDEATAILAGDALLTLAFEILAAAETHPDGEVRCALVSGLAQAAGAAGMAGGQMLDLAGAGGSLDRIIEIQAMKTGALFRFACEAGAILGGANPEPLRRYGQAIGLAFQISDDILDLTSNPERLGKATQKDHRRGKATLVALLGLEGAKAKAKASSEAAIDALAGLGGEGEMLRKAARFIGERTA